MDALIGKTIASVEEKQMAGRDTFKDIVTWTTTVLHFTDGTSQEFGGSDVEVYDAFEYDEVDENGWPIQPDIQGVQCADCTYLAIDDDDLAEHRRLNHREETSVNTVPCIVAGEHLKAQRHRWQECPVYHEGED